MSPMRTSTFPSCQGPQQPLSFAGLLCFLLFSPVKAFVPTVKLSAGGVIGISHTTITQNAVKAMDNEFFNVFEFTVAMSNAWDEIAAANANVDVTDKHNAPSHFDGESLKDGQGRLISLRKQVKDHLMAGNGISARQALGQALHTLQDFYSHSNWVEMGHGEVNRDILGLEHGVNVLQRPARSTTTCRHCHGELGLDFTLNAAINCQNACKLGDSPDWKAVASVACLLSCRQFMDCSDNLVKENGLTTGYYSEEGDEYAKPGPHKCSHGGVFDMSADGVEGINKDTNQFAFSPHYYLHNDAVNVAFEATKQFIREFKNDPEITKQHLQLLLGAGPSLAFAIDTTGSMEDIIRGVREEAVRIVQQRVGTPDEPCLYVLSQIRDPETNVISTATNADDFIAQINALVSGGGGDCPELAMSAILNAVDASDAGGSVFAFTDAAARDIGLAPAVAALAVQKQIKVFPAIFPSSCSSADGFDFVASESGGQLFAGVDRTQAGDVATLADSVVRSNSVDVLLADGNLDGRAGDISGASPKPRKHKRSSLSFSIPVDSAMRQLTLSLSSSTANLTVMRPDGSTATSTDPDVRAVSLSTGLLFTVKRPKIGRWTAAVTGSGNFSLSVTGTSPLHLSSFNFVEERGRPGHTGWFPVNGTPAASSRNVALAQIEGNFSRANFEYRTLSGVVIGPANLTAGTGQPNGIANNTFYGNLTLPAKNFVVYVVGIDAAGATFQRVLPARFTYPRPNISVPAGNTTSMSSAPYGTSTSSSTVPATTSPTVTPIVNGCGGAMRIRLFGTWLGIIKAALFLLIQL